MAQISLNEPAFLLWVKIGAGSADCLPGVTSRFLNALKEFVPGEISGETGDGFAVQSIV